MHKNNNKWAHFWATLSLLLLLSFAVKANQAPIENINGVPVDMDAANILLTGAVGLNTGIAGPLGHL